MKYQIFKAVDKLDGDLSIFVFDEVGNYTVVYYSESVLGAVITELKGGAGCHWSEDSISYPRRDDMVKPVLLCEIEA